LVGGGDDTFLGSGGGGGVNGFEPDRIDAGVFGEFFMLGGGAVAGAFEGGGGGVKLEIELEGAGCLFGIAE